jgi:hypothetical protein
MIINTFKSLIVILTVIIPICLFESCTGQAKTFADCKLHLRNAVTNLNDYYRSNKTSSLQKSLENVDQSIECPETKRRSIELKISLLILLKRYQNGYEFIDSLNADDFDAGYKKKTDYNYFLALDYESKLDTINRDKLLRECVNEIQNYINNEILPRDSVDEDAYLTIFMIKKKLFSNFQINSQIDSLQRLYPKSADYFKVLKNSIGDTASVILQRQ